ncbi:MAG: molybdopterin-binding protein [Thermodesulfobacteriota bacterium]
MCEEHQGGNGKDRKGALTVPVDQAVNMVLAHDITEIRPGEFKGRAFKKGHVVCKDDICRLKRLGKENLFVLTMGSDEMHEDDAAVALAEALAGSGVRPAGEPKEGKINLVAECDGLMKVNREALLAFNLLGEVMCASLHENTVVRKGQVVGATRAIPLVVNKDIVQEAVALCSKARNENAAVLSVYSMRAPRAGVVITGNEVYHGRIQDAFAPIIDAKIRSLGWTVVGTYYAPDDEHYIEARLRELVEAGADLLITTGGMSVDPDDVTRFAIKKLGAESLTYGSAVLPGAMFLVAFLEKNGAVVPVLGIPACGMYANATVFDLVLPRILAGERIERRALAALGHGGLCMKCKVCQFPVCPFGKG